ncbi:hypothetical protein D3C78_1670160 [compost metagenome]
MDIAEFMRVPDDSGDAAGNDCCRIGSGRYHRAFDVHMRVDQAGRDKGARRVDELRCIAAACRFVNAGD